MATNGDDWGKYDLEELEVQEDLTPERISTIRLTDVEASSLYVGSYPIEVAVCGLDMQPEAMLIEPLEDWTDWSSAAEDVHGISRKKLAREGEGARLVALRVNVLVDGCEVYSDAPGTDGAWYQRLFEDVGLRQKFTLSDYETLLMPCRKIAAGFMGPKRLERLMQKVDLIYPHSHRAGDDALRMAATLKVMVDPEWANWLENAEWADLAL
jgi:hypothetical protein